MNVPLPITLAVVAVIAFVGLGLGGCAAPDVEDGFADVSRMAAERVDQHITWRRDALDMQLDAAVADLLAAPLTAAGAVQTALLENRSLQATFERLGMSQADVVQAGMLANPMFSMSARFPDSAPYGTNFEFGLVQDFLDILVRPARQELAAAGFEVVKREVAAEVVALVGEVRSAYYAALGAQQVVALRQLIVDAAGAAAELAHRLHAEGNASDLQYASELLLYEDARVAHALADAAARQAREQLTGLMGLWRAEHLDWTLPGQLPDVPADEVPLAALETLAIEQRLDLAALVAEVDVLARALGISVDWRNLPRLEIGLSSEHDSDGQIVTGPDFSIELPLFDRGQARVARLEAELRGALQRVTALAVGIRSDVRARRDQLLALRRLAEHYRAVVIPLREARVAYTQQEYNAMLVGVFELILAKQDEYDSYQAYIETVRDYWMERAGLDRAVGGRLGAEPVSATVAPSTPDAPGTIYTCTMHPEIRRAEPGDCPECGMQLVPVTAPEPESHAGHSGHGA